MITYVATWVLAELLAVLMFLLALRAKVAFIPVGKYSYWGAAYPLLIGFIGWDIASDVVRLGEPFAADFILPAFFAAVSVALIFTIRAYARSNEA